MRSAFGAGSLLSSATGAGWLVGWLVMLGELVDWPVALVPDTAPLVELELGIGSVVRSVFVPLTVDVGSEVGTAGTCDGTVVLGVAGGGFSGVVWAYAKPTAPTMVAAATAEVRVLEIFIVNLLEKS
ncbi:MAG: hypothetical protein H7Y33_17800 [Cytophagales bacterium]|nr:hypothetical protein [Rhizobacter sp.]